MLVWSLPLLKLSSQRQRQRQQQVASFRLPTTAALVLAGNVVNPGSSVVFFRHLLEAIKINRILAAA
jgi:hypothetical protein